ncbi:ABC transporter substrate-binding protein [Pelagerythrobacter rhizovicinus]|uniref:ABC transporter substrate-binding protein n=1 Tax=Pelagerythrobacter rhizovicinus TaxID=2268576 RepID=A0A4Q2KGW0_9SPHN|nr:ABC transporter substrate-binding protein [Pelagerythrobacter rhizovicinus]RXZ64334.1 ABC transporter substrate-binding protein [Pelagerythrobacter rhizovicinus]
MASCGSGAPAPDAPQQAFEGREVPMAAAKTFRVVERDGYRVVDLKASVISWGGNAVGEEQFQRLVLVPRGEAVPALTGELEGATLIRTPVMRIASNTGYHEAMTKVLGINDRLVAVGGVKSYDDGLRARVRSGEVRQIGYGWHSPPELDALIAAEPDVLLMSMGDMKNVGAKPRIEALGIPVVPIFVDNEPDYMGRVDYVRLIGMLTGKEAEADAFVAMVARNVEALKKAAASQPTRSVISAWYGGGDRWNPTIRNADAKLLRDANGKNPFEEPDDPRKDSFNRISTEALIARGTEANCWILRDSHSAPFSDLTTLRRFKAYREGCLFASDGMQKPEADAFDLYEMAVIRPDLVLGDLVRMLHPALRDQPFRYIRPDTQVPR